ncbi:MAG: 50S ribosomal protein L9 [Deltaproteobacteria bacterium]|jgi:large subunit ribosomal protein L9|nr:50S ribosomal protein L9 [Deltaproteobacteria bacterium]
MKLILRADVENLGQLGDIVDVRDGYGRNCLLPKGLARQATTSNLKLFEQERRKLQARMDEIRDAAAGLAQRVSAAEVSIVMRVGDNDKLYGSVTSAMIAESLARLGIEVDRRRILLDAPIRSLGEFEVRVRLHADVNAKLRVKVVPEDRTVHDDESGAAQDSPIPEAETPAE